MLSMEPEIFGASARGASHKRAGKECQDSIGYRKIPLCGSYVLAVADGHGSESSPYSKTGSQLAVEVFCRAMAEYCFAYRENTDSLFTFLAREGEMKAAQEIDKEWKRLVLKTHADEGRDASIGDASLSDAGIYKQYGSTLVGLLVTPCFIFGLQIGDGDLAFLNESSLEPVISADKMLGVETHSLSELGAWKKSVCATKRRDVAEGAPYAFMLSTDGFFNSHANEEEYKKSCLEYFSMIKQHGAGEVEKRLEEWLGETSEMGCGDDISVLFFVYGK